MRPPTPSPGAHRFALSITLKLSLPGHHATGLKQNPRKCSFNKRENHKQETQMPIKPRRGRRSNRDQQGLGLQNHGGVKAQKSVTWTQWRARAQQMANSAKPWFPRLVRWESDSRVMPTLVQSVWHTQVAQTQQLFLKPAMPYDSRRGGGRATP